MKIERLLSCLNEFIKLIIPVLRVISLTNNDFIAININMLPKMISIMGPELIDVEIAPNSVFPMVSPNNTTIIKITIDPNK